MNAVLRSIRILPKASITHPQRCLFSTSEPLRQAIPLEGYYKLLLDTPFHPANALPPGALPPNTPHPPSTTPASEPFSPNTAESTSDKQQRLDKAPIVFGSRLASPVERDASKARLGKVVAGVRIPPKPTEPDNCCQSGCVNCVWDLFREDLEEYYAQEKKAQKMLSALNKKPGDGENRKIPDKTSQSEEEEEDLWKGFEGIPVGIRAFMETEKRLKQKHKSAGTKGVNV